ncbi:MAG: TrmH family RNA methyltransferase [Patescibacteria group bacterium]|jgi:TrmH family RNA methyltransferase
MKENISSLSNKKIKSLIRLRKSSERKKLGLSIVDGLREVSLALEGGVEVLELFYCPSLAKDKKLTKEWLSKLKITAVSESIFKEICYKSKPDGYLAIIKVKNPQLKELSIKAEPLIVILDRVEKPGNIGAVIRTAFAAGVDLIIITNNQTDLYHPNSIRASEGLIFKQAILEAPLLTTITWLRERKIKTYAAVTNSQTDYTKKDYQGPLALVFGSEAKGLGDDWLKETKETVRIPMQAEVDSLNISASVAILIYEARRQRGLTV